MTFSYAPTPMLVHKKWGTEEIIVNSDYCGKRMTVMPGRTCSIHYHHKKTETFFVLDGRLALELYYPYCAGSDPKLVGCKLLMPGRSLTIHPLVPHRFWAHSEPVRFIEFSTTDMSEDSIRLSESGEVSPSCLLAEGVW
jgi:mannose-6-phosphate isomerase-like protein (cupin superfamily)